MSRCSDRGSSRNADKQLLMTISLADRSLYRINFGSVSVRNEMDVPDTEIVDALPQ